MFDEKMMQLLDVKKNVIGEAVGTLQPYDKNMVFEGDIELHLSARGFCEHSSKIKEAHYITSDCHLYKIMVVKEWSERYEIQLYECGG